MTPQALHIVLAFAEIAITILLARRKMSIAKWLKVCLVAAIATHVLTGMIWAAFPGLWTWQPNYWAIWSGSWVLIVIIAEAIAYWEEFKEIATGKTVQWIFLEFFNSRIFMSLVIGIASFIPTTATLHLIILPTLGNTLKGTLALAGTWLLFATLLYLLLRQIRSHFLH